MNRKDSNACAVLLLDFTVAVRTGPAVTAAVPPSDPESGIGSALATSDLRKGTRRRSGLKRSMT